MTRRAFRYLVLDVFTDEPFAGNPLAVLPDARGLDDAAMQRIAREFNLSETAFVTPPTGAHADVTVRIFTPTFEVPFAGHPTLGTVAALLLEGAVPPDRSSVNLDERIGVVPVRIERRSDPFLAWLTTPPIVFGARFDPASIAPLLGLQPDDILETPVQSVSAGNPFLYVALRDRATVDRARLDRHAMLDTLDRRDAIGIFPFTPTPDGAYSRMLEPTSIGEDPATGSATGPLGAYLIEYGYLAREDGRTFTSEQGTAFGRRSFCRGIVRLAADGTLATVEVGGGAVLAAEGTIIA